jgi:hypothetical protein
LLGTTGHLPVLLGFAAAILAAIHLVLARRVTLGLLLCLLLMPCMIGMGIGSWRILRGDRGSDDERQGAKDGLHVVSPNLDVSGVKKSSRLRRWCGDFRLGAEQEAGTPVNQ